VAPEACKNASASADPHEVALAPPCHRVEQRRDLSPPGWLRTGSLQLPGGRLEDGDLVADESTEDESAFVYAGAVGARIRAVREQRRMSLRAVEELSQNEFRASVLGAYERGERSISVRRLQRLAQLYSVPVDQLLPPPDEAHPRASDDERDGRKSRAAVKAAIDLAKLNGSQTPEAQLLRHLLTSVQLQRQDFNGRIITIRGDDLRIMAAMFGLSVDEMVATLKELDLLHQP
jgi:transcriptional regulator with XRE-family HTH domain